MIIVKLINVIVIISLIPPKIICYHMQMNFLC